MIDMTPQNIALIVGLVATLGWTYRDKLVSLLPSFDIDIERPPEPVFSTATEHIHALQVLALNQSQRKRDAILASLDSVSQAFSAEEQANDAAT